jgi:hypothetical protein
MGERRGCKDVEKVKTRQNRCALPSADGNRRFALPPKCMRRTMPTSFSSRVAQPPPAVSSILCASPGCSVTCRRSHRPSGTVAAIAGRMARRQQGSRLSNRREPEGANRTFGPGVKNVSTPFVPPSLGSCESPISHPNYRALTKPLWNLVTPCFPTTSTPNYTTADWVRLVKSPAIDSLGRDTRNLICDKDLAQREGFSDA